MSDFNIQFEEQDQSITLEFEQIGGGAVKSVNGKVGEVVLGASDVGALPSSTSIPAVDATLSVTGAAADAKKTGDEITSLKEDYTTILDSAYVTDTASGSIASFPDGAAMPVKSLTVDIEPVQSGSGDPSLTNVRPISGHTSAVVKRCGKNIANELHHGNITGDGVYGTGDTRVTNATSATSSIIKITAGQYTLSAQGLGYCTALTKDNSGNIVDNFASAWHSLPYTFTVTAEAWLYFTCRRSDNASITLADVAVQVEKGSATAYEPYQSQTVTIDLDGTRYGGMLNATTGVLTVTHAFYTINGQYTINKHSANAFDAYYMELSRNGLPRCASTQDGTVGQFNMFKIGKLSDGNGCAFVGADTIQFRKDGGGTGAEMKAWLVNNPLQVVYPLATPFTVQLTANEISTLLGQNNIWSDAGTVDVEYRADTKLYIQKVMSS